MAFAPRGVHRSEPFKAAVRIINQSRKLHGQEYAIGVYRRNQPRHKRPMESEGVKGLQYSLAFSWPKAFSVFDFREGEHEATGWQRGVNLWAAQSDFRLNRWAPILGQSRNGFTHVQAALQIQGDVSNDPRRRSVKVNASFLVEGCPIFRAPGLLRIQPQYMSMCKLAEMKMHHVHRILVWMGRILHQLETTRNHYWLVFRGESSETRVS